MRFKGNIISLWLTLLGLLGFSITGQAQQAMCSYHTYAWNVKSKQAVDRRLVEHPYHLLQPHEIDSLSGCTVCREDQVEISLPMIEPFLVCKHVAQEYEQALQQALSQGAVIYQIDSYRVGKTRGPVDAYGNRTRFSNHSFGIALDINPQQNGLYDSCLAFGPQCRLRRGGVWHMGQTGSLRKHGPVVQALRSIGLKWGGEIFGKQKDFMHFSPTGY